ncbi:MAG: hypothetical protein GSR79_00820 [Desulfurococcales archaeon]|nr:hypothetical protein [Desulfurococcales archaeon]
MKRLSLVTAVIGILLISVGALLLQITVENPKSLEDTWDMIGPVNVTLNPGETYNFSVRWRIVTSDPRDVLGKNFFMKEVPFKPMECKQLSIPLLNIETGCSWWFFGVRIVNATPYTEAGNLVLVTKQPNHNYSIVNLGIGKWYPIKITSPGNHTTFILNTGDKPVSIETYYGLNVLIEKRPYITLGTISVITGVVLVAISIIYNVYPKHRQPL